MRECDLPHHKKEGVMLTADITAAMRKAHYELLPDEEGYFGSIENLEGIWANAETLCSVIKLPVAAALAVCSEPVSHPGHARDGTLLLSSGAVFCGFCPDWVRALLLCPVTAACGA
jgi:hypothetical protein